MCLTCGCMDAHIEMGEANITYEDVKRAADKNQRSDGFLAAVDRKPLRLGSLTSLNPRNCWLASLVVPAVGADVRQPHERGLE